MHTQHTRRAVLGAGIALAGTKVLTACSSRTDEARSAGNQGAMNHDDTAHDGATRKASSPAKSHGEYVSPDGEEVAAVEAKRGSGPVRNVQLTATPARLDLGGGLTVPSWAYGDRLPGKEVRITAGDTLAVTLANHLPQPTTLHWHGLHVRNNMDGVPGLTQPGIKPGAEFAYRFTVKQSGTYWFHPHQGVQQDRGLYAPLIVEDPKEPLSYDKEWVVLLDDWLDGVEGSTPDGVLNELSKGMGAMDHDTEDMDHGSDDKSGTGPSRVLMDARSRLLGGAASDVAYPYYLINGRIPKAPTTFTAKPGDRIRLRIVNAGGDTPFRVALGGHRMTITHADGFPVQHTTTDSLLLGMGERYDVLVTAGNGVFPLTALAEGRNMSALALLRTGGGAAPAASVRPKELDGQLVSAFELKADKAVALAARTPDRTIRIKLTGGMRLFDWAFDHTMYDPAHRHPVEAGERVRLEFYNITEMWHPVHLHGHTFALAGGAGPRSVLDRAPGARKDTAVVLPNSSVAVEFDADNPGLWMLHCHNVYHSNMNMMTVIGYRR
ncbi:multicopper oxidase family protein [Streptomyces sp. NBC_00316]|uniref:multicopper oxidase family protein n=1 Tax=Streptomyces sp. NBC_00316 TaxID=2975710 RepID=UPI002E2D527F|nr:multicopper oxidase family protein [Streptomyces sp. NBC_00316]